MNRIVFVSGTKYGCRETFIPLISQLPYPARLYLLDYPENYAIGKWINVKNLESYTIIPGYTGSIWKMFNHHRACSKEAKRLLGVEFAAMIVDCDFSIFHQYFIRAARKKGVPVAGVETVIYAAGLAKYELEADEAVFFEQVLRAIRSC